MVDPQNNIVHFPMQAGSRMQDREKLRVTVQEFHRQLQALSIITRAHADLTEAYRTATHHYIKIEKAMQQLVNDVLEITKDR